MNYRPEIDGLRAIAVIPVILFHAGLFSGGFIGVDIFFVISGYLITSIILNDLIKNQFSLKIFYERRARRILPALFLVMIVSIPFAWFWMEPVQMKEFSRSIVAVVFFVSNILFWKETDYFANASEEKPLLHTWSLSVEEQFYLFFPLMLIILWKYGRYKIFWIIAIFSLLSLIFADWGSKNSPTANFFLAPSRAWELYAGSLSALFIKQNKPFAKESMSLLGLLLLIIAFFIIDKSIPYPGFYTLVPVIGVVLIIVYGNIGTITAKILSYRPIVFMGLLSYSMYLWHQPIFAFTRLKLDHDPRGFILILLIAVTVFLSFISWKYIEIPFRNKKIIKTKKLVSIISIVALALLSFGFAGHKTKGFEKPLPESIIENKIQSVLTKDIYVIGDSHGSHLIYGLKKITSGRVIDLTQNGCIPHRNLDRYDSRMKQGSCLKIISKNLDLLSQVNSESIVIFSSMGPVYLDAKPFKGKDKARILGQKFELTTNKSIKDRYQIFRESLINTLNEFKSKEKLDIIYSIDVPELGIDRGCGLKKKELNILGYRFTDLLKVNNPENCYVTLTDYKNRTMKYKSLVKDTVSKFSYVRLFDPSQYFCDDKKCHGFYNDTGYLYKDQDHLSNSGSVFYAKKFAEFLSNRLN